MAKERHGDVSNVFSVTITPSPCQLIPSEALYLVDQRVMEKEFIYTDGGSEYSLVKISTADLVKANGAQVVRISK